MQTQSKVRNGAERVAKIAKYRHSPEFFWTLDPDWHYKKRFALRAKRELELGVKP